MKSIGSGKSLSLKLALLSMCLSAHHSVSAGLAASSAPTGKMMVRCTSGQSFEVELHDQGARIVLGNRNFELMRRPSSIGIRYGSNDGALMIDGDFVAFVPSDDPGFTGCKVSTG